MTKTLGFKTRLISIDPQELLLLERNARFMRHEQFARLVENVRRDGKLTSVPFACKEKNGKYRVLSGNHRTRAAIEAGLATIDVMVTDDNLTEDQRTAIQLSHNAIAGEDDLAVLKAIYDSVEAIDWREYSGLDDKTLELLGEIEVGSVNEANLDFQTLTIVFLPSEIDNAKRVIDDATAMAKGANEQWLTQFKDHTRMLDALMTTGKAHGISNVATALGLILDQFEENVTQLSEGWWHDLTGDTKHTKWVPIATATGLNAPAASLGTVKQALDKIIARGEADTPWQALEMICADYLAGN